MLEFPLSQGLEILIELCRLYTVTDAIFLSSEHLENLIAKEFIPPLDLNRESGESVSVSGRDEYSFCIRSVPNIPGTL